MQTENGGEFVILQLKYYCGDRGISLITPVAYNLAQNGQAERQNWTHIKGARTMLKDLELGRDGPVGQSYLDSRIHSQ